MAKLTVKQLYYGDEYGVMGRLSNLCFKILLRR